MIDQEASRLLGLTIELPLINSHTRTTTASRKLRLLRRSYDLIAPADSHGQCKDQHDDVQDTAGFTVKRCGKRQLLS